MLDSISAFLRFFWRWLFIAIGVAMALALTLSGVALALLLFTWRRITGRPLLRQAPGGGSRPWQSPWTTGTSAGHRQGEVVDVEARELGPEKVRSENTRAGADAGPAPLLQLSKAPGSRGGNRSQR